MEKTQDHTVMQDEFTQHYLHSFPAVARLVKRSGGSLDDARDVFQDALVALYEKRRGDAGLHNPSGYLHGIARNLWLKKLARDPHVHASRLNDNTEVGAPDAEPRISDQLYHYIARSGDRCLQVLKAFYYDRLTPRQLAARFGFSGERSATVQKHKCLEKVKHSIQQKGLKKENFYE